MKLSYCPYNINLHALIGSCYANVRKETKVMRDSMDENSRLYNAPTTEVINYALS